MKKMFAVLACVMFAGLSIAGEWFPLKITVPANATNASDDVELVQTFGDKCYTVDRFTATVLTGSGTGTVSFVALDHGIESAIATSGNLSTTTLYSETPKRTFVTTEVQGYAVVTGNVVVTGSYVNTVTNKENYLLRTVRVKINQPAASSATVYGVSIYAK